MNNLIVHLDCGKLLRGKVVVKDNFDCLAEKDKDFPLGFHLDCKILNKGLTCERGSEKLQFLLGHSGKCTMVSRQNSWLGV